jgi:hypothetical protein
MNEERTGKFLQQVEYICGHLSVEISSFLAISKLAISVF